MARKILATAFAALFVLAIAAPAIKTNIRRNQRSHLDNRMLNEFPRPKDIRNGFRPKLERALRDRVGFRNQMLTSYLEINNALFGILEHQSYLEGKDGHLYYNDKAYIDGYRNIYDEEIIDLLPQYLARIEGFLEQRGTGFFFFLPPDKKTVYPEYFPAWIHKTDATPFIEALESRLDALCVDYVSPLDAFLSLKGDIKLYNKQFDIVHWNSDGALEGISLLLDRIHAEYPEVPPLDRSNYEREITKASIMDWSEHKIDEDVPKYTVKNDSTAINEGFAAEVSAASGEECTVYDNAALGDGLTALVFHDSYFGSDQYRSFLRMSFKRAVFVHHRNLDRISWYFNLLSPDIVILEVVERVIDPSWTTRIYSSFLPRASSAELAPNSSVNVLLKELDIARREKITIISGKLAIYGSARDSAVTSVYAKVNSKEYPTQVDADGSFSLALANTTLIGNPDIVLTQQTRSRNSELRS